MERLEALRLVAAQALHGELVFPTGLDVSLTLLRALDDPDCHVDHAVRLVKGDPLLAARVVAVANASIYCRPGQQTADLRQAVARIGLRTTRTLAVAIATRRLAGTPQSPRLREAANRLWAHTSEVAALAQVIARRVSHVDPETAFFAGVVHEIGGFYLISRAADMPTLLDGDPGDWTEDNEAIVGRAILARLDIPPTVCAAIEAMWEGLRSLPPASLGDTLLLADELALTPSPLYTTDATRTADSAPQIDAVVNERTLSEILAESAGEVAELAAALRQ
ncbi:HD-like signal output (HDOD) protein [Azonexus fungiphilus]|uniref:HD-like signal output (HDOD) protein n=1 Tax=Azonexus fungiphilus TaxID=146940 RepID=A0A495WCX9_9RHOO|nr:HDOD domain-containing protein [Azonexus fungiphilus]RKT58613.1 HD-like signal output (HDOD) protein [Azonexus fungiphilus]